MNAFICVLANLCLLVCDWCVKKVAHASALCACLPATHSQQCRAGPSLQAQEPGMYFEKGMYCTDWKSAGRQIRGDLPYVLDEYSYLGVPWCLYFKEQTFN